MDDNEHDQLQDIHTEVRGSNAKLGAIDERTRNIERHVQSLSNEIEGNSEDINELEGKVKRNTTILGGFSAGLTGILLWGADKISRIV